MIFRLVQSIGKKMKKQLGSVDLLVNLCCLQTVRQLSLCLCPVHLRIFHLRFSDDNDNVDNIFAKKLQIWHRV